MTLTAEPSVSLPPFEETPPPTRGQTLATLIRSGSRRRPYQAFHQPYLGREASCAMGALYEGLLDQEGALPAFRQVIEMLGVDFTHLITHPVTGGQEPFWNVIISLNDTERWSREQIADWLEEAVP